MIERAVCIFFYTLAPKQNNVVLNYAIYMLNDQLRSDLFLATGTPYPAIFRQLASFLFEMEKRTVGFLSEIIILLIDVWVLMSYEINSCDSDSAVCNKLAMPATLKIAQA